MLRKARRKAGLNQTQFGQKIGLSQHLVSRSELGDRKIDVVELCQMCEALDLAPVEFVQRFYDAVKQQEKEGQNVQATPAATAKTQPERTRRKALKDRRIQHRSRAQ